MDARPSELPYSEFYRLLISSVAPRPIGWISTISAAGQPNLAPFSFFNAVCGKPPMLVFGTGMRTARAEGGPATLEIKDTLRNVRETREFVANVVTYELAERMNLTSGEYVSSVNEFEVAGLTARPSTVVGPPMVAESPVNFECQLYQIVEFSSQPGGGSLVIGEIVYLHVNDALMKEGWLDANALDLIGRMGGTQYSRTAERFDMVRPKGR
ncbi:MAG TPA: flavin reductase family protein [Terriglobales bacterium]|nr:flavin reductase family protein [Terriglobales bacterium]